PGVAKRRQAACPPTRRPALSVPATQNRLRSARVTMELGPASPRTPAPVRASAARADHAGWRWIAQSAFPFLVVGAAWEAVAHAGLFPQRLFPPLEVVAAALA